MFGVFMKLEVDTALMNNFGERFNVFLHLR